MDFRGQHVHRKDGICRWHPARLTHLRNGRSAVDEGAHRSRLHGVRSQRDLPAEGRGRGGRGTSRRAIHAFDTLNHFFLITEMIIPGSCYWNIGIGREPGEVEADEEGIQTMKVLGRNTALLLKRIGP